MNYLTTPPIGGPTVPVEPPVDRSILNGQDRRWWLDRMSAAFSGGANHLLGPAAEPIGAAMGVGQYSDAGDFVELGDSSGALWDDPSMSNALRMATAVGAAAIPMVSGKMMADGVDVFGDAARSFGDDARRFGADEYGGQGRNLTPAQQQSQDVLDLLKSGRASEVTNEMLDAADDMYLFDNYDLPMDEASRLARAEEMGFDVEQRLYHGTTKDFSGFDPNAAPRDPIGDPGLMGRATYLTGDPKSADLFASMNWANDNNGARQIPVYARSKNPALFGDDAAYIIRGYHPDGVISASGGKAWRDDITGQGHDAADFRIGDTLAQKVISDPSNIRSQFARFDPRLSHLRNLSAGLGGMALLNQSRTDDNGNSALHNFLGGS